MLAPVAVFSPPTSARSTVTAALTAQTASLGAAVAQGPATPNIAPVSWPCGSVTRTFATSVGQVKPTPCHCFSDTSSPFRVLQLHTYGRHFSLSCPFMSIPYLMLLSCYCHVIVVTSLPLAPV